MNALINKLVNTRTVLNTLMNLKFRWEDECHYENFDRYGEVIFNSVKKVVGNNAKFVKAMKRPFGLIFELEGVKYKLFLKSNARSCWLACAIC